MKNLSQLTREQQGKAYFIRLFTDLTYADLKQMAAAKKVTIDEMVDDTFNAMLYDDVVALALDRELDKLLKMSSELKDEIKKCENALS